MNKTVFRENPPRGDGFPVAGNVYQDTPEERMIGDFDDSANALWSLYGKEAKSHDEARIQTLKEDMEGVLIFVRLYFVCSSELRNADA
jgi:hypothetical protein